MKFSAARETVLKPLQTVVGVVERRQTMPILSNVLLSTRGDETQHHGDRPGSRDGGGGRGQRGRGRRDHRTRPQAPRHFRALPEGTSVELSLSGDRLTIKGGRSRFTLSTLRAADFPTVDEIGAKQTLRLNRPDLRRLVEKTHFSMAQQDVRYYLNGLLLETEKKRCGRSRRTDIGWRYRRSSC